MVSSPDNVVYRLTGFYGHPSTQLRSQSWELLRRISSSIASDWFVFGDFNEILFVDEKNGRRVRPLGQILRFRAVIEECGLTSVPFEGYPFTWSNGRVGEDLVEERIDRGFANFELMNKYSHIFCSHLIPKCSDHRPLLFQLLSDSQWTTSQMRKRRRFQFEEVWVSDNACQEVIKHSWALSKNSGANICDSIQNCASALSLWGTQTFGSINFQLRQVRRRLDAAYSVGLSQHNVSRISQLESQLSELQDKEEVLWRQRSRITWLQLGDRNTRFFHERASGRKRNNTVHGLFDSQGIWQTDSDVIGHLFCDFFAGLFTKTGGILMERVLSSVLPLVSPEMNTMLLQPFERKDLEFSLFRMQPSKSPGVDGMSALFFQRYWSFIGDEVSTVCLQILNGEASVQAFNHTLIALIPKVSSPTTVADFRPISLCTVMYKIVAKTFANRLKKVLPSVIYPTQCAFVPNRQILDNVMIGFEATHFVKRLKDSALGAIILKLDMAKAYDRVEWSFLEVMMIRLGFHTEWVRRIMDCLTSVSFSILWNGNPLGHFLPSRGIRQGCPLSPYLFLFVAEGFSTLLRFAESSGCLAGVTISRFAPSISHLFYADDSLLFLTADQDTPQVLKNIFRIYEEVSGQQINFQKSAMSFSPNIDEVYQEFISAFLGIPIVACHERYLGLPTLAGRRKKTLFKMVRDRVWYKVNGWKEKLLSQAGKEVLLKSVVQAIPSYSMSVFHMPVSLGHELSGLSARFWWGRFKGKKGIHWLKWSHLCRSKLKGGLGFRDFVDFNQALLAKQCWRFLSDPNSLVARVYKGRYFPHSSILNAPIGRSSSFIWRSLLWGRELLSSGLRWRVGDGSSISLYTDAWIPILHSFRIMSPPLLPLNCLVSELIADGGRWNLELIYSSFWTHEAAAICSIPLPLNPAPDRLCWHFTKNGVYSVKSGYHMVVDSRSTALGIVGSSTSSTDDLIWKTLWHLKVPTASRVFF